MIPASRFIETSDNRDAWLAARHPAVTATEVAGAATTSGFQLAVQERLHPTVTIPTPAMQFGTDNEEWIARFLKREFGIMPNRWLIAAETNPLFMATPDGLSLDHKQIGEVKTWGTEPKNPSMQHRRQVQWGMFCSGAETAKYAGLLRAEVNGVLVPAWFEPKVWHIDRDEQIITELLETAHRLLEVTKEVVT